MNIAAILQDTSPNYRAKPLFRYRGGDVAYDDFVDQVSRLGSYLKAQGIGANDRIMIVAHNKPEWMVTLFAALGEGVTVIPVNPGLTAPEIAYMIEHAGPRLIVVDREIEAVLPDCDVATLTIDPAGGAWKDAIARRPSSSDILARAGSDPALMFYTSGTTGRPKGAILSHGAEVFTAKMVAGHYRLGPKDITLIPNSLSFIYPLVINCLAAIYAGATVVLQERFHPELCLRGIEQERATIFMGVPTMFGMMLDWAQQQAVDASSLRFCISAGQNLSWNVATRFRERFGISVFDLWGQTEGTPITGFDPARETEGKPESCGRALPGCAVRVIDEAGTDLPPDSIGEVLLRGPSVFIGYDKNPLATAETLRDGWVHTGDLGKLDADGCLYIVGRKRDMVIRGGANIYPVEIEEAIYAHPAVAECAVIGVPDALYGETLKAVVVVGGSLKLSENELIEHCRSRLAAYKVPAKVLFVDKLPKGPTGKILKRELRAQEATAR
jgi:long-chain acyl-CoA synthetase